MRGASSVDTSVKRPAFDLDPGGRLAMIALGYLPLAHLAATLGATAMAGFLLGRGAMVLTLLGMIYLVPPLGAALARPRRASEPARRRAMPGGITRFLALVVHHTMASAVSPFADVGRTFAIDSRLLLGVASDVGGEDRRVRLLVAGSEIVRPAVFANR